LFDASRSEALFVGFLLALSSTAIVLSLLQERAEIDAPYGRIALSVLIFQDLIIVPMMLAVPFLAGTGEESLAESLPTIAGKMAVVFVAVGVLSKVIAPRLLMGVVRTRSRELFLLTILTLCFAVGWLTHSAGLSLALGAFMAGLIVSESDYSHDALEGILPFRDVFTNLFFVSVGMLLDLAYFFHHLPTVVAVTVGILLVKSLLASGAALALGVPLRTAITAGLALAQVGEFSFVLAGAGKHVGLLSDNGYQLFLAASVSTMAATPFVIMKGAVIARRIALWRPIMPLTRRLNGRRELPTRPALQALSDHMVIIGFGVVGKHLARAATVTGLPYTILEMNPDTVREFSTKGESIAYGDATRSATLSHTGVGRARALAVTIADPAAARRITELGRSLNPSLYIVTRTRFMSEIEPLTQLGADDIISEEFETSVEIFTKVMARYLVPRPVIERFTNEVRAEGYAMLRSAAPTASADFYTLKKDLTELDVIAYQVDEHAQLAGVSIVDANLRSQRGLTVMAIRRGGEVVANPGPQETFLPHDLVYLFGGHNALMTAAVLFDPAPTKTGIEDEDESSK
jgi:CPA2 family monovalent cation:H+ antiporter-2